MADDERAPTPRSRPSSPGRGEIADASSAERLSLPALDSFVPGPARRAGAACWREAAPRDPAALADGRLAHGVAGLAGRWTASGSTPWSPRSARRRLPIDSVTVVRHGYVVLDAAFGRFASGTPRRAVRLRTACTSCSRRRSRSPRWCWASPWREQTATASPSPTPRRCDLAAAAGYRPRATLDRAQAGDDPRGHAHDAVRARVEGDGATPTRRGAATTSSAMTATSNWTQYVVDRPMAAAAGDDLRVRHGHVAPRVRGRLHPDRAHPPHALADIGAPAPARHRPPRAGCAAPGGRLRRRVRPGTSRRRDLARLAFLYLHHGRWDGRQVVPADWVEQLDHGPRRDAAARSTATCGGSTAPTATPTWRACTASSPSSHPADDLVAVITGHIPAGVDASTVTRSLLETYVLPAAG